MGEVVWDKPNYILHTVRWVLEMESWPVNSFTFSEIHRKMWFQNRKLLCVGNPRLCFSFVRKNATWDTNIRNITDRNGNASILRDPHISNELYFDVPFKFEKFKGRVQFI